MITRIVSIAFVLVFGFTARSQVSSTELSYFPHSIGDTWTYKVSVDNGVSGPVFSHYSTTTVDRDSVFATGKRYYHYGVSWVRIDSLDGRVYVFDGNYGGCPDPYEREIMNVTVDTSQEYTACQSPFDRWEVTSSDARAGLLYVTRHQRTCCAYTGCSVFPNPATDHATIFWNTRSESPVKVSITDLLGRVIWNAAIPANSNRITWNCRGSDGAAVSPGIYLAGVRDGATSTFVRMIIIP